MDTDKTYSYSDLEKWDFSGTALAVIGQPIQHSLSPTMQNALIRSLSEREPSFSKWAYFKFEIDPNMLSEALQLFHSKKFLGLNLTLPHKVLALDSVKAVSESAKNIGAINTLKWTPSGYVGYNTDGYGLEMGIKSALGVGLNNANVLILGAGGAARAAVVQALKQGARSIYIRNRSKNRLNELMNGLSGLAGFHKIQPIETTEALAELPEQGICINATSLGLKAEDPLPLDLTLMPAEWSVYDMVYNPKETQLTKQATEQNRMQSTGLGMLVHQGARAFELWSEKKVDALIMEQAAEKALEIK